MVTFVRLTLEMAQRLDRLAVITGRTKAYYLRELIERGKEDVKDVYLAQKVL